METTTRMERRQELLRDVFHSAPVNRLTGMRLEYDADDAAVIRLPYNPELDHGLGRIFGGIVSSMIDFTGWFTVAPHYENWMVTVEYTTRLLAEVARTDLRSRGIVRKLGRSTAFADMEVWSADGTLVAIGSGTFRCTTRKVEKVFD